jgi:tetratricopeptide (TPR) repeat protein
MLQSGLAGVPELDIVSGEKIDEAVRQIAREENIDRLDASFFPEIARRAGARTFLTGSIVKSGSEIRIDAQLEDVADGSILSAHTVRGTDVLQLVDDLARRMGQGMDLDEPLPRTKVSGVTASLEAYRLYSQGVEARRHLRLSDADRLFLEAIAVDPDFGLAYWELHKVALVRHDKIAAEGYLRRSLANRERLPERQQLLARAGQLVHQDDGDEAVELLEGILERYPDEEYAYVLLAIVHLASNRTEQGLAVLASGVKAVPDSGLMRSYYGYGMLRSGRYPEAIRQFEDYAQMYPGDVNPYDRLGEAYLIAGMPERALEEYSRAPGTNGSSSTSSFGRSWASATMGQYAQALEHLDESGDLPADQAPYLLMVRAFLVSRIGRYLEAEQHLQQGIRLARDRQDTLFEARTHILAALLAVEQGAFADAVRRTDRAFALLPNLSGDGRREILMLASLFAGLARARDRKLDAAMGDLDSLRALYDGRDPRENWWYHLLEGEIALAQWDFRTAEVAFADGEPELKMWFSSSDLFGSIAANLPLRDGSARAKKLQGDVSGAIRIYRKLLTPDITQRWTGVLEPLHVLELARLLAQQGNLVAAGQQYERFVSLWSRADPDSLGLAEAQQFLAE